MSSQSPSQLAARWRWLLALLLLALLVWWVGGRLAQGPHPEIGVTGDQELPRVVAPPSPTPVADEVVERPPAPRAQPSAAAEGGEPSPSEPVRASPSPRR